MMETSMLCEGIRLTAVARAGLGSVRSKGKWMTNTAIAQDVLLTEDRGAVRVIRLNRPDKMNALTGALMQAILDALLAADAERTRRRALWRGTGLLCRQRRVRIQGADPRSAR
jgi:hypothetical protein